MTSKYYWIMLWVAIVVMLGFALLVPRPAESEGYQDRYLIATEYYQGADTAEYRADHDRLARFDRSAARTMRDAAQDVCRNRPGDKILNPSTFECEAR